MYSVEVYAKHTGNVLDSRRFLSWDTAVQWAERICKDYSGEADYRIFKK